MLRQQSTLLWCQERIYLTDHPFLESDDVLIFGKDGFVEGSSNVQSSSLSRYHSSSSFSLEPAQVIGDDVRNAIIVNSDGVNNLQTLRTERNSVDVDERGWLLVTRMVFGSNSYASSLLDHGQDLGELSLMHCFLILR